MRAGDASWLLGGIARSRELELPAGADELLDGLVQRGLVRHVPDAGPQSVRLGELRATLAQVGRERAQGSTDPTLVVRERALRTQILELSELVAASEGATVLRRAGGAPYRGDAHSFDRVQVTQDGRRALADLEPRHARAESLHFDVFATEMAGLRAAFDDRAARAAAVLRHLRLGATLGPSRNAALVGLSILRAEPAHTAWAFDGALTGVRRHWAQYDVAAQVAAAECLCQAVSDLRHAVDPQVIWQLVDMPNDLQARFRVPFEDALDAAAILTRVPADQRESRLVLAQELSSALSTRGRFISLAYALIAIAGEARLPPELAGALAQLDGALAGEVRDAPERIATAALLFAPRNDPGLQLQRWRVIRQYLARVSPEGMSIAAALLAWLALEPAEILDNLRLASQALAKHGMAGSGAETVTTASKLLLAMASMAAGGEGDPEERLALAPLATPALPLVGLPGTLAALPLTAVTAFHYTVLSVASAWERSYHPTHSSYVFGGRSHGHYRG